MRQQTNLQSTPNLLGNGPLPDGCIILATDVAPGMLIRKLRYAGYDAPVLAINLNCVSGRFSGYAAARGECVPQPFAHERVPEAVEQVLGLLVRERNASMGGTAIGGRYGLTTAEERLLERLAQGHRLSRVARELRITVNTARSHLKRVFHKTGTHRQAELIRLVLLARANNETNGRGLNQG